jgi:hypothetical protein
MFETKKLLRMSWFQYVKYKIRNYFLRFKRWRGKKSITGDRYLKHAIKDAKKLNKKYNKAEILTIARHLDLSYDDYKYLTILFDKKEKKDT